MHALVIPAQIRAGRSLLGWSQEELMARSGVGLSTIREIESQRRSVDTDKAEAVRLALDNAGVVFVSGDATGGPGVRLAAHRPNILRRPTVVTKWEGVPFDVEVQGRAITVFVSREALEDLDRLRSPSDAQLLASFERHIGKILDATVKALREPDNYDREGRLYLRTQDFFPIPGPEPIVDGLARLRPPKDATFVRLRPLPQRIWRGQRGEERDDLWAVERLDEQKGYLLICNTVTGHYLPLHPAHVRDFLPDPDPRARAAGHWLLDLTMQLVFEDGHPRLERLPADGTNAAANS